MEAKAKATLKVLTLYKALLKESQKLPQYNFRMYALRRIKSSFRDNKNLQNSNEIDEKVNFANKQMAIINRQAILGNLYSPEKLVIEN